MAPTASAAEQALDALLDAVRDEFTTDEAGRTAILHAAGAADPTLLSTLLTQLHAPRHLYSAFYAIPGDFQDDAEELQQIFKKLTVSNNM